MLKFLGDNMLGQPQKTECARLNLIFKNGKTFGTFYNVRLWINFSLNKIWINTIKEDIPVYELYFKYHELTKMSEVNGYYELIIELP